MARSPVLHVPPPPLPAWQAWLGLLGLLAIAAGVVLVARVWWPAWQASREVRRDLEREGWL
jgi:hypothetical protein